MLLAQQGAAAPKEEPYDPDKLPLYEKSCGMPSKKQNTPCDCMKHKQAMVDREHDKCDENFAPFTQENKVCHLSVNACPAVTDAEKTVEIDGIPMPKKCSRSCTRAKCLCCKT